MRTTRVSRLWNRAATFDHSLRATTNLLELLRRKEIRPVHYSRRVLFENMATGEPSLFRDFPVRLRNGDRPQLENIVQALQHGFKNSTRARVRGANRIRYLGVPQVVARWRRGKSIFGVTDLHYIGTAFDCELDTSALNDFNLLPRGTDSFQSQDSLVLSTIGAVTDSHSDDHGGSNHCFVGSKLWLLWDTAEGLRNGLEDVERCDVTDKAAFNPQSFASLPSSRWLLITSGCTMFIPGNLTHKVITLESYIGLGSFHVAFPSFPRSLLYWTILPPLWTKGSTVDCPHSVEFLTRRAIRKLRSLSSASAKERYQWGLPFMRDLPSAAAFDCQKGDFAHLSRESSAVRFVRAANAAMRRATP
jgi:hypothetical protein